MKRFNLHLVSDSTGETVSSVARAAMAQFDDAEADEHMWSLVRTKSQMDKVIHGIKENPGPVMFTLVDVELRELLRKECLQLKQPCIAVLNGVVSELSSYLGLETHAVAGRQHQLDDEYFTRVDAINYALAHDDGQAHWELEEADIVLVGPSRTSKSPTCMYLSYKGFKAANVPYVMGCPLPPILTDLRMPLVLGLTISPDRLQQIRKTRLQSLKQEDDTNYADGEHIQKELEESRKFFHQQRWPVIDVTKRSVEETAANILQQYQKHKERRGE
jgi:hypothetical protein